MPSLKTLKFESDFKTLKVLEIGFSSLKVLEFLVNKFLKININTLDALCFRVIVCANVHGHSMQMSCNATEMPKHSLLMHAHTLG